MKNRFTLFVASLLVCASSFAQWVKPAAPASTPLAVGEECYLYNKEADGFLLGANEWGTRASVSATLGHKVYIQNGTIDGSYYITNYVLDGGMKDQIGYMFFDDFKNIWVDNTIDGKKNNQYTFQAQGDGTYKIGLSDADPDFLPKDYANAYLGLIPGEKPDNRIYFCDPENTDGYDYSKCQLIWYFVTPSAYEAYSKAVAQYDAAVRLGDIIAEAKRVSGVSADAIAKAEKVYANTSATVEELTQEADELAVTVKFAKFAVASVANPLEILSLEGIATDFNDGTCPGWESTTGATNKQANNANNALDEKVTGFHYENWSGDAFAPGKITAKLTDIPAGVYHLNALAYSNSGQGAYLYAGKYETLVTATKIDADQSFDAYAVVTGNSLEIGLDIPAKGPNWVGLDNVQLYYLGNSAEAYEWLKAEVANNSVDYIDGIESGEMFSQASVYADYKAAKTAFDAATAADEVARTLDAYSEASQAMALSTAAYAAFDKKYQAAEAWSSANTSESEEAIILGDYLNDDTEAEGLYNGNGGALYVLGEGLLNNEQIAAETAYLDKLFSDAMANAMSDGDDCTALLKNPDFTEEGGWNAAQGINWPMGSEDFRVFEAYGRVADVHQQLSNLQNGIYEMNLQAVYKPDGDEAIRQTYAYINDFDTKIPVPNDEAPVVSIDDASKQFAAGAYPVKVYGLVHDGTMKIGIANRLRTGEQAILWAGGVKLTFRAKNADACASMVGVLAEQAQDLKDNYCGQVELDALAAALTDAKSDATDYDALKALKVAIDAVNEGTAAYTNLKVAIDGLAEAIENAKNADAITIENAKKVLADAQAAYDAKAYDNEDALQAITDVNAASVSVKMGKTEASEANPVDYTSAIVNNNFDPAKGNKDEKRIDGWVVTGALNGYKSYSCSFNKGTFDLHQDLSGLPKGKYKVTVHTYYRAGSYEEEEANINAGKDTHLMKLYANGQEVSVMNLSEGSKDVTLPEGIGTRTINGITVPDGTGASVACYEAGLFLNELVFSVAEDGLATIGLKLPETIGSNDYTVVGEWKLWYMGDGGATEQDLTDLIVNNNFDPAKGSKDDKRIDGWNVEGALNGYKSYSCSFNKGTFKLTQDLSGLPKGKYKVTVNTYYRAGSYEEEEANINAGKDTHLMKFFANTSVDNFQTNIMNLSEGSKDVTLPEGIGTRTINGITVPDGTGASVACYEAGLFLNELEFMVGEDGKATIGLKLEETIGSNDYTVVGPWHLYYYGEPKDLSETDLSDLIVNNNFDPAKGSKDEKRIDGWSVEGALNGYKSYSCSFNKGTFKLTQDLSGLP